MNIFRALRLLLLLGFAVPPLSPAAESGAATGVATPARRLRDPFLPASPGPSSPADSPGGTELEQVVTAEPSPSSTDIAPVAPDWTAARKQLVIGGITRFRRPGKDKDAYAALVNGRLVEAGDLVSVVISGFRYQWRVADIGPQGISFSPVGEREQPPR